MPSESPVKAPHFWNESRAKLCHPAGSHDNRTKERSDAVAGRFWLSSRGDRDDHSARQRDAATGRSRARKASRANAGRPARAATSFVVCTLKPRREGSLVTQLDALLATIVIELAVGMPLLLATHWVEPRAWWRAALLLVAASLCTHPVAWQANVRWLSAWPFEWRALVIELAVTGSRNGRAGGRASAVAAACGRDGCADECRVVHPRTVAGTVVLTGRSATAINHHPLTSPLSASPHNPDHDTDHNRHADHCGRDGQRIEHIGFRSRDDVCVGVAGARFARHHFKKERSRERQPSRHALSPRLRPA